MLQVLSTDPLKPCLKFFSKEVPHGRNLVDGAGGRVGLSSFNCGLRLSFVKLIYDPAELMGQVFGFCWYRR